VSGSAEPGQLLAIIGSLGAGKTTLLNILSSRVRKWVSGSVQANGKEITSFDYQSYVGYATQEDILLDTFTPRESLTFAANLRLQGTAEAKKNSVERMLRQFKLTDAADSRIGSIMERGISGGEWL
jgi:ATP-binding cassette subfamily G (WHITE) protein 2